MQYTPHNYQAYCIQRVVEDPTVGLFLRPGLGKTVITLSAVNILKYFRWQVAKVLVVAPKKVAEATWSKEAATLYNYIYRGDVFLHLTPEHLHNKGRRHYAAKSKRQAARSSYGKSIENRPQEVKGRGSFGHWEMDSIMGCKGSKKALLVLTERRTRMGIVMLLEDHTAASVVKAINSLERRFGKLFYKLFKSITVDNGCEFQDFEGIEAAHRRKGKRTIVFFCHPYSAFERGSNENMNRLIRRFFPKGTSFDTVKPEEVRAAERWVNNYPRKLLGWKSAAMLFEKELLSA